MIVSEPKSMIRKTIENGTKVFHEALGFGIFIEYLQGNFGDFANIQFEDRVHRIHRKRLTEIEEEE